MNNIHVELIKHQKPEGEVEWQAVTAIRLASCPSGRISERGQNQSAGSILAEQVDLINALFHPEPPATFAVRFIALPDPSSFSAGRIEICLFAKTSAPECELASSRALDLAGQLLMQLAGTFPDYTWQVITDPDRFKEFWQPIDWGTAQVIELRRREELVKLDTVQSSGSIGFIESISPSPAKNAEPVYFVHPFTPRAGRFERMLRIMLLNRAPLVYTASLSPVLFTPEEEQAVLDEIARCEGYRPNTHHNLQRVQEQRARMLSQGLMDQLLRLQDAPFQLTISLASPERISPSLAEAVGVAVSAPVGEGPNPAYSEPSFIQTGGYDVVLPGSDAERLVAVQNASTLSQTPWAATLAPASLQRIRSLVDGREASSAFRFPEDTAIGLPGIEVHARRIRPLPREVARLADSQETGSKLMLGTNDYLGLPQPVFLPEHDRQTHMYVVGQTGTGKTTLLKTMILSDMQAGRGLALIDPHGDLFEEMLGMIPPERMKDVVIFDPTDVEFPVGFNLLECADDEQRHIVVREMRAIMRRLLEDQYQHMASEYTGPIFYQHMQMNMLLAMSNLDNPGTLLEFYQIYQSENYWRRWVPLKWADEQLKRWVDVVLPHAGYTDRSRPQDATMGDYLSAKFVDFIFDPRLRMIFGQRRSTINLQQIMDGSKILMVNLAKGLIGEANAQFLGLVLMAKFQAAVMARAHLPPSQRNPFYLYVDEFQSLATENFTVLLSEARKFGVGLVLANQFISQIKDPRIMQAVFGNVGTLLSFRLGREDAQVMEQQFLPYFDHIDLVNLPNWQACVKATISGQALPPFNVQTILPSVHADPDVADQARKASRLKYGTPHLDVERTIVESLKEPKVPEEDNGSGGFGGRLQLPKYTPVQHRRSRSPKKWSQVNFRHGFHRKSLRAGWRPKK